MHAWSKCGITLALLTCLPASATYHVFVRTNEGVWLASDSLLTHTTRVGKKIPSTICKVVITKDRLIFNSGGFKNLIALQQEEAQIPIGDEAATEPRLSDLFVPQHMSPTTTIVPMRNDEMYDEFAGVIQVDAGRFIAYQASQTRTLRDFYQTVNPPFEVGVVHDLGNLGSKIGPQDRTAEARKLFLKHPKAELLKIMKRIAEKDPTVRPPYTVLLLRNDGTVSDVSDADGIDLCKIPHEAKSHL